MRRRTIAGVVLAGAALVGIGLYVLRLSVLEHVAFGRHSAPFYLLVDRHVADFPTLERAGGPVRYDHAAEDGTSPRRTGVAFDSALTPEALGTRYAEVCRAQGYVLSAEKDPRADLVCRRGDEWLLLSFRPRAGGSAVRLTFEHGAAA